VQLLVSPDHEADGGGRPCLAAVAAARRRVWVEMYLLTDLAAVDALVAARARGVDVRVLLEPSPYGAETANDGAFTALTQAGVDVRWFQAATGLVHAKVLLVDERAWISTANLTAAGLDRNREYTVVDPDAGDVNRVAALWQRDAIGVTATSDGTETRLVISPIDARSRLTALMDDARASITLEVEELSDGEVVARLIAARERGVAVSVVVPAGADRAGATSAAATRLAGAGVDVRASGGPPLHAKAMAVDDAVAYVGSVNLTRASLDDNREVGVLVTDVKAAARIRDVIGQDGMLGASL
jgi:phosphatidylserine/phosphatidylglycerophosphate/cardiolipin synthase-like enzyme